MDSISTFSKTGPSQLKESFISELGQHAFKKAFLHKKQNSFYRHFFIVTQIIDGLLTHPGPSMSHISRRWSMIKPTAHSRTDRESTTPSEPSAVISKSPASTLLVSWAFMFSMTSTRSPRVIWKINKLIINPLSPNSDQHQFSPNNIQWLSRDKIMRINKWSPKRKYLNLLLNSLNWFIKEMYGDHFGEFVCWYWDLKG